MTTKKSFPKRALVTSGLPYSNGDLHVGHIAGALLPSDIYTRYLRLNRVPTLHICGSDDHGVAIMITAEKEGKTPAEVAGHYNKNQKRDTSALGINFDYYGATCNNETHSKFSQSFFKALYDKNYFSKKATNQFYDSSRGEFLPDRYVKGTCAYCQAKNQNSDQCEECGKILDTETLLEAYSTVSKGKVEVKETVHWFIDLSSFQSVVSDWLKKSQIRDTTKKFVEGLIGAGLVSRSMTRDISWGIPVPLDDPEAKNKVLYVWFDAPIGYVSNTATQLINSGKPESDYENWWKSEDCEISHFIGEDNTIFHCIIWIAMLSAEGSYQLPSRVIVNNFMNFKKQADSEVEKMSKSRGSAVFINEYIEAGNNPDMLRYYLTSIAPEKARTVFSPEDLIQKNNSDLANTLGNFVNRILSFTHKYFGPAVPEYDSSLLTEVDLDFQKELASKFEKIDAELYSCNFKNALEHAMDAVRSANKYVDVKAPWTSRKTDLEATKVTLALAISAIKFFTITLSPFIPFSTAKMAGMIGLAEEDLFWDQALVPARGGSELGVVGILFGKVETNAA